MKLMIVSLGLVGMVLTGCAATSRKDVGGEVIVGAVSRIQCGRMDWFKVGLNDGAVGHTQPERYNFLSNACSGHGFRADTDAYFKGVEEGKRRAGS
jgi:hypothetical protein